MATSTPCEPTPDLPSAGPACETCKKPDMSNMTWEDGAKNFFSIYFATPRMWPIGYILGSSYSPLWIEQQMPDKNWRDAFEDLLALENGRKMVSPQSRKAEDEYMTHERFEQASFSIAECNHNLKQNTEMETTYRAALQRAVEQKEHNVVKTITNDLLPWIKSSNDENIARAQQVKTTYDFYQNSTASRLKMRGHWIASLMDSGALPAWKWGMCNSSDGPVMSFSKRNPPADLDAAIELSELELDQAFDEGRPIGFGSPALLSFTAIRALVDGTYNTPYPDLPNDPLKKFRPSPSSVIVQQAECDLVKLPDGSTVPSVKVQNILGDGTTETKDFVHNPAGLLKEVTHAQLSMAMMRQAVNNMYLGPGESLKRAHKIMIEDREQVDLQTRGD
ncbi:MAG: hypothetical protein Q9169_004396 [Polycauliona sp. 2 TL-2023]